MLNYIYVSHLCLDFDSFSIHLYLGIVLLVFLALHIILHWKMVVHNYRRLVPRMKKRRMAGLVYLFLCLILVVFPFLLRPQVVERNEGRGYLSSRGEVRQSSSTQVISSAQVYEVRVYNE